MPKYNKEGKHNPVSFLLHLAESGQLLLLAEVREAIKQIERTPRVGRSLGNGAFEFADPGQRFMIEYIYESITKQIYISRILA